MTTTTSSPTTADLLLESLIARKKYHRTDQLFRRVVRVIKHIDGISYLDESSAIARLVEYFMEGITTWFPDEPVKSLLWLLSVELEVEELPSVKAARWLNIYRTNDALPENCNPEVGSIVLHFRGKKGLEGCWFGNIDNIKDVGVMAIRTFLYTIEDAVENESERLSNGFCDIDKILDIADALATVEDDDH